jgi:hypothetical protein
LTQLSGWLRYGSLPLIVLIFYFTAVLHFSYTPDDTFIYLQYAKNLVAGDGFSFNAGEQTYGFTGPLWLLLIAAGGLTGMDLYIVAKVLDLLFACAAILIFFRAAFEMMRDAVPAFLATVVFSSGVWLVRWAGTGMETSLAVFLALLAFVHALRNRYLPAIVTAALLALVRPEGGLLAVLVMIDLVYNSNDLRAALRKIPRLALLFAVIVLPWHIAAGSIFGTIIPNTALAKSGPWFNPASMWEGLVDVVETVGFSDGIAVVVMIVAGVLVFRRLRVDPAPGSAIVRTFLMRQNLIPAGLIVGLPLLYIVSGANVVSRYLMLIVPFIGLSAFTMFHNLVLSGRLRSYSLHAIMIFAALALLQNQVGYWNLVKPGVDQFEVGMQTTLVPFGKWLKSYAQPGEAVYAWDIGALGYYSDHPVIDGSGLATPSMIPLVKSGYGPERMMREKMYRAFPQVRYLVRQSQIHEEWSRGGELSPVMTMPFHSRGIMRDRTEYFTLYKITSPPSDTHP